MNTIGERIVFLRQERDISQKELANMIQIPPTSLSRYENNQYEPKAEIIFRLAHALNTTADFLLGLSDIYERPNDKQNSLLSLTAQEHHLVSLYRKLTSLNQVRIFERVETLLDMQSDKH